MAWQGMMRVTTVGDVGVGKTCIFIRYTTNQSPLPYPYPGCTFHAYSEIMKIAEETYTLQLWETPCQEGAVSDTLRPHLYTSTTVFLVCFSIVDPRSFKNVQEKWVPEIKHHCPNIPFLLVGTQIDLRYDRAVLDKLAKNKEMPVSKKEGEMLAKSLKAGKYVECSSLTGEGIKNVFTEAFMHDIECRKENVKKTERVKRGCFVF